jgi:hypothetical protein
VHSHALVQHSRIMKAHHNTSRGEKKGQVAPSGTKRRHPGGAIILIAVAATPQVVSLAFVSTSCGTLLMQSQAAIGCDKLPTSCPPIDQHRRRGGPHDSD